MPLQKRFLAIVLILNGKKSLSAPQLSRDLHVNKNTDQRISVQICNAMAQAARHDMQDGIVEIGETYVDGKPRRGTEGDGPGGKHKKGRGPRRLPYRDTLSCAGR